MTDAEKTKPSVLFVCVHNAGRSQMGAAYTTHLSGGAVEVRSAGSAPAETINPAVREAMLEEGIDISAEKPKILTTEAVQASDVVITMGCGDTCPYFPGKRYLDWVLEDPAGQGVASVRPIRDEIKRRVPPLLRALAGAPLACWRTCAAARRHARARHAGLVRDKGAGGRGPLTPQTSRGPGGPRPQPQVLAPAGAGGGPPPPAPPPRGPPARRRRAVTAAHGCTLSGTPGSRSPGGRTRHLSLIHISEPTRPY